MPKIINSVKIFNVKKNSGIFPLFFLKKYVLFIKNPAATRGFSDIKKTISAR